MKTLRLEKTKVGRTAGRYLYKIFDGDQVLCQRTSNRNYVACHVYKFEPVQGVPPTFAAPMFFGRVELISKQRGTVPYGIAYLADEKPVVL